MSKFLFLGMPFHKIPQVVTATPAQCLGLADRIGKIALGYEADLILCRMENGRVSFEDADGNCRIGDRQLKVQTTIQSGEIVFLSND